MKIYQGKSKTVSFARTRVKDTLNYFWGDQRIPEASSRKYLGINSHRDLNWVHQVNYTVPKAWRAFHFIMSVIINGNSNTKSSAYMSLARPILEYGASCWEPYMKGQINALDRVQKKEDKFANQTNDFGRETLAQRRKIARIFSLFKECTGRRVWKTTVYRLKVPSRAGTITVVKLGPGNKELISVNTAL